MPPLCEAQVGTFYHLMWFCPIVQTYWYQIVCFLHDDIESPLSLDPRLCLLGLLPDPDTNTFQTLFQLETLFVAHKLKKLDADNPSYN